MRIVTSNGEAIRHFGCPVGTLTSKLAKLEHAGLDHAVLLRFAENKASAQALMTTHHEWLSRGFADGVFVLAGSIQPAAGGAIVAHGTDPQDLRRRLDADPFVAEGVVRAEVVEIAPGRVDDPLACLLDGCTPAE